MSAAEIVARARKAGLRLEATERGTIAISPADRLTIELRHAILANKPAIIAALRATGPCDTFTAPVGVATCSTCGYGLGLHFWRLADCTRFKSGDPTGRCRRCGIPALEHLS